MRARRDFSPKLNDLAAQENILFARDRPRDRKAVPLAILPSKEWVRYSLGLLKRMDFVVDLAGPGTVPSGLVSEGLLKLAEESPDG